MPLDSLGKRKRCKSDNKTYWERIQDVITNNDEKALC